MFCILFFLHSINFGFNQHHVTFSLCSLEEEPLLKYIADIQ